MPALHASHAKGEAPQLRIVVKRNAKRNAKKPWYPWLITLVALITLTNLIGK
jgi:hypothetical protein